MKLVGSIEWAGAMKAEKLMSLYAVQHYHSRGGEDDEARLMCYRGSNFDMHGRAKRRGGSVRYKLNKESLIERA